MPLNLGDDQLSVNIADSKSILSPIVCKMKISFSKKLKFSKDMSYIPFINTI